MLFIMPHFGVALRGSSPSRLIQLENAHRQQFVGEVPVGELEARPWGYRLGPDSFCEKFKISSVMGKAIVPFKKRFQKQESWQNLCSLNGKDGGGGGIDLGHRHSF